MFHGNRKRLAEKPKSYNLGYNCTDDDEHLKYLRTIYFTDAILDVPFEFIKVAMKKKPILLINKFTFAQTTNDRRYWHCSSKFSQDKCPARVRFDSNGQMVFHSLVHGHPPPMLFKQMNGVYIRISS
ncbi:jg8389 [Pararge aegeria aegeria]|uniref:Jg8389 protein n=1 Tax=Pararge aegeria aegeria TaxID=348720 RepID=A0A8S4SFC8_9NEOP|nr:jg8389 [Pararge aegeria aegeria]